MFENKIRVFETMNSNEFIEFSKNLYLLAHVKNTSSKGSGNVVYSKDQLLIELMKIRQAALISYEVMKDKYEDNLNLGQLCKSLQIATKRALFYLYNDTNRLLKHRMGNSEYSLESYLIECILEDDITSMNITQEDIIDPHYSATYMSGEYMQESTKLNKKEIFDTELIKLNKLSTGTIPPKSIFHKDSLLSKFSNKKANKDKSHNLFKGIYLRRLLLLALTFLANENNLYIDNTIISIPIARLHEYMGRVNSLLLSEGISDERQIFVDSDISENFYSYKKDDLDLCVIPNESGSDLNNFTSVLETTRMPCILSQGNIITSSEIIVDSMLPWLRYFIDPVWKKNVAKNMEKSIVSAVRQNAPLSGSMSHKCEKSILSGSNTGYVKGWDVPRAYLKENSYKSIMKKVEGKEDFSEIDCFTALRDGSFLVIECKSAQKLGNTLKYCSAPKGEWYEEAQKHKKWVEDNVGVVKKAIIVVEGIHINIYPKYFDDSQEIVVVDIYNFYEKIIPNLQNLPDDLSTLF